MKVKLTNSPLEGLSEYRVQNTHAGHSCPFGPRTMPGGQSPSSSFFRGSGDDPAESGCFFSGDGGAAAAAAVGLEDLERSTGRLLFRLPVPPLEAGTVRGGVGGGCGWLDARWSANLSLWNKS